MGDNINLEIFSRKAKCNKNFALFGVFIALLFSCAIIVVGFIKYNPDKPIIDKTVVTKDLNDKPSCKTTCCALSHKMESAPVEITETYYNNSANLLLYTSILVFMFLSLWGTFTFLFKVLKSESEINFKILDVQKDIFKEQQMTAISNGKKENNKEQEDKNKVEKYDELSKKIETLEVCLELIRKNTSYDDKKILNILKDYIGIN